MTSSPTIQTSLTGTLVLRWTGKVGPTDLLALGSPAALVAQEPRLDQRIVELHVPEAPVQPHRWPGLFRLLLHQLSAHPAGVRLLVADEVVSTSLDALTPAELLDVGGLPSAIVRLLHEVAPAESGLLPRMVDAARLDQLGPPLVQQAHDLVVAWSALAADAGTPAPGTGIIRGILAARRHIDDFATFGTSLTDVARRAALNPEHQRRALAWLDAQLAQARHQTEPVPPTFPSLEELGLCLLERLSDAVCLSEEVLAVIAAERFPLSSGADVRAALELLRAKNLVSRKGKVWTFDRHPGQPRPLPAPPAPSSDHEPLIKVDWLEHGILDATFVPTDPLRSRVGSIHIEPHRARLYAYRAACETGTPSPETALTDAQLRSLRLMMDRWDDFAPALASVYPPKLSRYLEWDYITMSWQESGGHAYVTFRGHVNAQFAGFRSVEATLLGLALVPRHAPWVHDGAPQEPPRLGSQAPPELRAEWERARERRSRPRLVLPDDLPEARRAFLERYFTSPDLESALAELEAARGWVTVGAELIPPTWFDHDLTWILPLVAAGVVTLPRDCLHGALDVPHLRWWAALGAPIDGTAREGDAPHRTALARSTRDPTRFAALLELGADPRHLFDAAGHPYRPFSPEIEALLANRGVPPPPPAPPPASTPPITQSTPEPSQSQGLPSAWQVRRHLTERARKLAASRPSPLRLVRRLEDVEDALLESTGYDRDQARVALSCVQPVDHLGDWLRREWIELGPDADPTLLNAWLALLVALNVPSESLVDLLLEAPGVEDVFVDDEALQGLLDEE